MILPQIGITFGDPGGIGPEVTLKMLSSLHSLPPAHYVLFGSRRLAERERDNLGLTVSFASAEEDKTRSSRSLSVRDIKLPRRIHEKGRPGGIL